MMKKIRNMTIATRLIISFVPIIIIFGLAIIQANYTTSHINTLHRHNIEYVVARSNYILYIQRDFMAFRRLARATMMNPQWREVTSEHVRLGYERELTELLYHIEDLVRSYHVLVHEDPRMDPHREFCMHTELMAHSLEGIHRVYDIISGRFFLAGDHSYDDTNVVPFSEEVYDTLQELRMLSVYERENTLDLIYSTVESNITISAIMTLAFLLFAVVTATILVKSYKQNVQDLGKHIALVEQGAFEEDWELDGNNEISNMFAKLTKVFTTLVNEIDQTSTELKNNNTSVRINTEPFQGAYSKTAVAINTLIDTMVESKKREVQALSQLSIASERAAVVFDYAPLAMSFWTFHEGTLQIQDLNKSFMEMFGVMDKDKLLMDFSRDFFTPELQPCGTPSREYILKNTQLAVKQGSHKFDLIHQDINLNPVPCEILCVSVRFRESRALISYATDMREIIESQRQVKEANERVELMLDSTPIACFLIDKDFNAIDCNMEAVSLFEMPEKKMCIHSFETISRCSECVESKDRCVAHGRTCAIRRHFNIALEKGSSKVEASLRILESATLIPCEINYVRLVYKDDFVVAAYISDIRIRKKMIEDSRKLEIAEENNLAKSQFLASMSHEIRTPMNAILGITEIQLQKTVMDADLKEAFEKIYVSGDMLIGIINDILDLSKIEAGKMEISTEKYEIISLVHDTVVLNMMRIESKPIEFKVSLEETTPVYMLGDELRIKQIINNVLSNGFKYTHDGVVEMSVGAEETGSPDEVILVIVVSDTGQGMSKDQIDVLFETYSRFNPKANRYIEGTGLGMSITKNMVELMGGTISVESELGKGSTFTIRLPQKKVDSEQVGKEAIENLNKLHLGKRMQTKLSRITYEPMPYGKVLIVDDVDMNIYVAKGLMMPYELQIDSADSGMAAIDKIKKGNQYDVVFMDHMMPQMDGIETVKHLRDMGYTAPIVALTANALTGQVELFLKNGFDDFISKPIDTRQLNSILNKLIRDKQSPEVLEAARSHVSDEIVNNKSFNNYVKNSAIYDMVYRDFGRSQKNVIFEIRDAIAAEDFKTAHFLTHTLKGLASLLIDETKLVELAAIVETASIKETASQDAVDDLEVELNNVFDKIRAKYGDISDNVDTELARVSLDVIKAKDTFDRLTPLLEDERLDALKLCEELKEIPETGTLIEQIEDMEFELALETLEKLRKTLEV
ncbi:MAG: ATP-binding protein [Defluviitaleaceae bacterium]|nr:ATP-binding protein [Defluviitaleaceae bacterium]